MVKKLKETHGKIMTTKSSDKLLTGNAVKPEYASKILVIRNSVELDALRKMIDLGVKGLVVGGIDGEVLTKFLGYEIGVVITGTEEVGLTLIITEGFGNMKMPNKTFELLKKFEGKEVSINGATQIRAGVIRPEIIMPYEDISNLGMTGYDIEDMKSLSEGLKPGMLIRIIREPHFGALGRVVNLPSTLHNIESESKVQILEAELEDGKRVIIPKANVEIIGE